MDICIDFETRSQIDLKKVGAYNYFEHPSTGVWCMAYGFTGEEPQLWLPGQPAPSRIVEFIKKRQGDVTAWNLAFDRSAWNKILVPQHGFPPLPDDMCRCTMVEALSMNLPGKLELAAPALGLDIVKDNAGHRLMLTMCRPRKTTDGSLKWWDDDPVKLKRLYDYCLQDVRVEMAVSKRVFRLIPKEREYYLLDMRINDLGVYIDEKLCLAAAHVVSVATKRLDDQMESVTGGEVSACTNVMQIVKYLRERGVETKSVDREHIEDLLTRDDLPEDCRRVLELRQEGSKTSTAKIKSMLERRQKDGRARGNIQFYGASDSGRAAARGIQTQNLARPILLKKKYGPMGSQIQTAIEHVLTGNASLVEMSYGRPLTLVADLVRSMICAEPGRILWSSDFSNIEGRDAAWLAGEEKKLAAFKAYDNKTGPDVYLLAGNSILNTPVDEVDEDERQIGKFAELSLGFGGGARAFAKMSKTYGMKISEFFEPIWEKAKASVRDQARENWVNFGKKTGMSEKAFLAAECIKLAWREQNPKIVRCWAGLEQASALALKYPGEVVVAGKVKYKKAGSFLFCQLPSGRALCYPYAQLKEVETDWGVKETLVYKSIDQFTHKWAETSTYGGKLFNNVVQGSARDILYEAMVRTDKAGYTNVLNVHDEIVAETPKSFGNLEEFNSLMCVLPKWAAGFPIAASGWTGERYRKA